MNILVNSYNPAMEAYTEYDYPLPPERDIREAIDEVRKLHPQWTSMVVTIVNSKGGDHHV